MASVAVAPSARAGLPALPGGGPWPCSGFVRRCRRANTSPPKTAAPPLTCRTPSMGPGREDPALRRRRRAPPAPCRRRPRRPRVPRVLRARPHPRGRAPRAPIPRGWAVQFRHTVGARILRRRGFHRMEPRSELRAERSPARPSAASSAASGVRSPACRVRPPEPCTGANRCQPPSARSGPARRRLRIAARESQDPHVGVRLEGVREEVRPLAEVEERAGEVSAAVGAAEEADPPTPVGDRSRVLAQHPPPLG